MQAMEGGNDKGGMPISGDKGKVSGSYACPFLSHVRRSNHSTATSLNLGLILMPILTVLVKCRSRLCQPRRKNVALLAPHGSASGKGMYRCPLRDIIRSQSV